MRLRILSVVGLLLGAGLVYGFWPFVDRSGASSSSSPEATLLKNPGPLQDFIAHRASGIDAFEIVNGHGAVLFSQGEVETPCILASARKSVVSLLFGIAWDKGLVRLDQTLADLGIDEPATPLTASERSANLEQLLQSRSGVYLPAGAESPEMRAARPRRGQFPPGEHFYYNNWDFNVLGTAFEAETGMKLGDALDQWLARPLGMQDFKPAHVYFDAQTSGSAYSAYRIHMSARDLARLGVLVLQRGKWNGRRVVSEAWLQRSLAPSSTFDQVKWGMHYDAYGYSWWLDTTRNAVVADGWGGQYLYIDRANDLVLVARRDIGNSRLGFLWFSAFKKPGNPDDLMKLRDLALGQLIIRQAPEGNYAR